MKALTYSLVVLLILLLHSGCICSNAIRARVDIDAICFTEGQAEFRQARVRINKPITVQEGQEVVFSDCFIRFEGGSLEIFGKVTFDSCKLIVAKATTESSFRVHGGHLSFANCTFQVQKKSSINKVISTSGRSDIVLSNCQFKSRPNVRLIVGKARSVLIEKCTFKNIRTKFPFIDIEGKCFKLDSCEVLGELISSSFFINLEVSDIDIFGLVVSQAELKEGLLNSKGKKTRISNCRFANIKSDLGEVLRVDAITIVVSDCEYSDSTVTFIYYDSRHPDGTTIITRNRIRRVRCRGDLISGINTQVRIEGNTITKVHAGSVIVGVYSKSGTLTDNFITDNRASRVLSILCSAACKGNVISNNLGFDIIVHGSTSVYESLIELNNVLRGNRATFLFQIEKGVGDILSEPPRRLYSDNFIKRAFVAFHVEVTYSIPSSGKGIQELGWGNSRIKTSEEEMK